MPSQAGDGGGTARPSSSATPAPPAFLQLELRNPRFPDGGGADGGARVTVRLSAGTAVDVVRRLVVEQAWACGAVTRIIPRFIVQAARVHSGEAAAQPQRAWPADAAASGRPGGHDCAGVAGLTPGGAFYVALSAAQHLDQEVGAGAGFLAIGDVVEGMSALRDAAETTPTGAGDRPHGADCAPPAFAPAPVFLSGAAAQEKAAELEAAAVAVRALLDADETKATDAAAAPASAWLNLLHPEDCVGALGGARAVSALPDAVRFRVAARLKTRGNSAFVAARSSGSGSGDAAAAAKSLAGAARFYEAALRWLGSASGDPQRVLAEKSLVYSNMSACCATAAAAAAAAADADADALESPPEWGRCRLLAREALKCDAANHKAGYRYALALSQSRRPDDDAAGLAILSQLVAHAARAGTPCDPSVRTLHAELRERCARRKNKMSSAMAAWTNSLAADDARAVAFRDARTGKAARVTAASGGGITYTLGGEDRGRVRRVELQPGTRTLRFAELRKALVVPRDAAFPPAGFLELCGMQGVEVTTNEAAEAEGGGASGPRAAAAAVAAPVAARRCPQQDADEHEMACVGQRPDAAPHAIETA